MPVTVVDIINDLNLEVINRGENINEIKESDINRPGLQFSGFYNYYANERVQIVGKAEWSFLDAMQPELRKKRLGKYFEFDNPCTIITRNLAPHKEFLESAILNKRWILRTDSISTRFINKVMNYLDDKLAPETRIHGVLVDVYGIGILITGESGIGKSETALELIKRGHRLVADDAVDIKQIDGVLHGTSPYITSGMIEVRGMGIIDIPALYGLSSVLKAKDINMIIYLEQWKEDENYDRLGIDKEYLNILNVPVRKLKIPIRPGRNLAVIIEAAAANYRYSLISNVTPVDVISERINEVARKKNG
ncbi:MULTISPECIES: HPr(Ser) kinase/phosphatase [Clostridium]|uniref:HPr kinase/phosphorylase n=2 Tax=Clostridium TaxID=1485 RepID=D8GKB1_CLOLD|nr:MULTISPECIES: HPr(Ser) kinase/phosphatase [Clostridium]ADK15251.1 predicted HPr kinase/phosphorylase [Clostridium ljungdahlii DSM 13528]OAA88731.1 HPr kinase/phosphorylase [Clostridium ljungdahlii DSM 13528]OAA94914.1 HPr kinase/phosphorylase [Clostridium coskatii]OBR91654.1 HPr kinase/phosphorylase [Clostridium coskatii]